MPYRSMRSRQNVRPLFAPLQHPLQQVVAGALPAMVLCPRRGDVA